MLYVYEKVTNVFESNRQGLCQSHCKDIHQKITRGRQNFKPIPKELTKELIVRGCAHFYIFSPPGWLAWLVQDQMTITFLRFFKFFLIFFDFLGIF